MKTKTVIATTMLLVLAGGLISAVAQGAAFTYQGLLTSGGVPFTGNAEFQPTLWNAASGGTKIADNSPPQVVVAVSNGLFMLPLDFGASFPGAERWLQLEVRTALGPFTLLSPRQKLTPTPYAITASNLSGPLPASQLTGPIPSANLVGTYSGAVTFNNAANSFSGNGAGLTSLNASQLTSGTVPDGRLAASVARTNQVWLLGGNAGTTPGTHFVGTTDNQPLELRVNGQRVLRLEPKWGGSPNVISGSPGNYVALGIVGATLSGGGTLDYGGVAYTNAVAGDYATIGGGLGNSIQADAGWATIGGGSVNTIEPNGYCSTIAGGEGNEILRRSDHATIGGGAWNTIRTNATGATISGGVANEIAAGGQYATIGGGDLNAVGPNATNTFIGGGYSNIISADSPCTGIAAGYSNETGTNAAYGFIGGGQNNTIVADSWHATIAGGVGNTIGPAASSSAIGGGYNNSIAADSWYATIAGGVENSIGINADYSLIAGGSGNVIGGNSTCNAIAGGLGNAISENADYSVIGGGLNNFIRVNADYSVIGGGSANTIATNAACATIPGGAGNFATNYAFAAGRRAKANHTGAFVWGDSTAADLPSTNANSVTMRASGGYRLFSNSGATAGVYLAPGGGSWTTMSDRNAKEDFQPVNPLEVLAKVAALPVTTWKYKSQDGSIRHIGPTAQDFHAAFGVGETDTGITGIDADGVALAAIQGLNQKLETENRALRERVGRLERLVQQLLKSKGDPQ